MEPRKYNVEFRKKISSKLEKIKEKNYLIKIYNMILENSDNKFSSNSNGLFYDLNSFNDTLIESLNMFVDATNKDEGYSRIKYKTYTSDKSDDTDISNSDLKILKRMG